MAEETMKDIWETLTDKQKNLVYAMLSVIVDDEDDNNDEEITHSDELKHYGVLGMKWGMRKYQNSDGTLTEAGKKRYSDVGHYEYRSHRTNKLQRKVNRLQAKANKKAESGESLSQSKKMKLDKNMEKLARSKIDDLNYQNYAKKTSVAKGIAQNLLFGSWGARGYQQARANGTGRFVSSIIGYYTNTPVTNMIGRHVNRTLRG